MKIELGRGRTFRSLPWAAVLAMAMLSTLPRDAFSATVPDSVTLARLRTAAMERNRFRIVTDNGQFQMTSLRMDAEGVVVLAPEARPAVIVTSETNPGVTKRAPWSEIERIEGMRSRSLKGAMLGGLIGGIAGLGAKQFLEGHLHDASAAAILAIPIGALLGGVVGAVNGSTTGWRPLYP